MCLNENGLNHSGSPIKVIVKEEEGPVGGRAREVVRLVRIKNRVLE